MLSGEAQQESSTRKAISWSVTVYNKTLSSQCNLTTQIEPVQDKTIILSTVWYPDMYYCTMTYYSQLLSNVRNGNSINADFS
jgi:hypothetical protein